MQRRYRPYRWGNRLAVGVLAGQLIGMLQSPLGFPVAMPAALESAVVSFIARAGDVGRGRSADVEVAIGRAGDGVPITVNAAEFEGGLRSDGAGDPQPDGDGPPPDQRPSTAERSDVPPGTTSGPGGTRPGSGNGAEPSGSTTRPTGDPGGPGSTGGTAGGSPSSTASSGAPTSTSTPQSGPPGTDPPPGTTDPGDDPLDPVTSGDPCALPTGTSADWMVTLEPGDGDTLQSRLSVVATAAGLPTEQFTPVGPVTWRVTSAAGGMCSASKLVEVVSVDRLP